MTNMAAIASDKARANEIIRTLRDLPDCALKHLDMAAWLNSDRTDPIFSKACPGKYTPTSLRDRWYDCEIIGTIMMNNKAHMLIWTLAGDHVAIVVPKDNVMFG